MTTSDVVHVITGLEVGGAEMLLLELCREDIRYGRTPSVASLMSDGPMRERFAKVGVQVIGLGMRRGNWSVPGLLRLVRIIRRKRPRIVQGWLYHGNLAATVATWASGVRPRPPARLGYSRHPSGFHLLSATVAPRRPGQCKAVAVHRWDSLQQPDRARCPSAIRLPFAANAFGFKRYRFGQVSLRPDIARGGSPVAGLARRRGRGNRGGSQ